VLSDREDKRHTPDSHTAYSRLKALCLLTLCLLSTPLTYERQSVERHGGQTYSLDILETLMDKRQTSVSQETRDRRLVYVGLSISRDILDTTVCQETYSTRDIRVSLNVSLETRDRQPLYVERQERQTACDNRQPLYVKRQPLYVTRQETDGLR